MIRPLSERCRIPSCPVMKHGLPSTCTPTHPTPCQFHENEKFAKFIMLPLNLEFVVDFEKSKSTGMLIKSWYVQLKGIYYYSLIKGSQLNSWGESELCTFFMIFTVVIRSVCFSGLSRYTMCKIFLNIMAHIRRNNTYLISDQSPWISILHLILHYKAILWKHICLFFSVRKCWQKPSFLMGWKKFFLKDKIWNFQAKQNKHVV